MISFTLNRIYILSWMQLSDIPFFEHDDHVLLSNEPFRRNLNIRLPDIPFFSFSRLSRVLVSNESFRSIWNIRLPDIFLDSFTLKRIHTLSTFLGSHLKNKLMNISFETNESLSSELGHFPFRCIFETNIPAPCIHIFLLASFKRTFKIHKISLESGWLTKFSVAAVSTTSSLSLSLSTMEREPYFTRVSIKRTKWK